MKLTVFMISLLTTQMIFAQSLNERKIKQEMLERVDTLLEKIDQTQAALDADDVIEACQNIHEIKEIYPEHLKSSAQRLKLNRRRTSRVKDLALDQLIFFHKQSVQCKRGKDSEYVDPSDLKADLKRIEKSLKKQRKIIKRNDTDQNNSFRYRYRFEN